ncbi:MAG TPA: hypothetical protein VNT27_07945 [Propionibacteriaceae bacterium]|nr:hypothetical protein [Propionibacteriaceae bacterium]
MKSGWEISANLGRYTRTSGNAHGWLWEITRGPQLAHLVIEISDAAWLSNPLRLPDDTRRALETDGRTELLKVLARDELPRLIRCDVNGCTYPSSKQPS